MIEIRGKREKLPKLLYTVPSQSRDYVQPICLTYDEWNRMKATLHKNKILAEKQAAINAEKKELHRKSEEITKNWAEVATNIHLRKKENARIRKEQAEQKKDKLSQEERRVQAELRKEYVQKVRLQMLCDSQKGRLITKAFLAAASDKECERQILMKQTQRSYDDMVENEYAKAIIENQKNYLEILKAKEETKKKATAEYYKDLGKQLVLMKERRDREKLIERLDHEQMLGVLKLMSDEEQHNKHEKIARAHQLHEEIGKQCAEKEKLEKYKHSLEEYEDKKIQTYVKNKRELKNKHADFLKEQERLREEKKQKVFDMMTEAKRKIAERDTLEDERIKKVREKREAQWDKEQQSKREKYQNYVKDLQQLCKQHRELIVEMKEHKKVEDTEEILKDVEDGRQNNNLQKQTRDHWQKFTKGIKDYQQQQIIEKSKHAENEKLLKNMHEKHVKDAIEQHQAEINEFAEQLISYATEREWPTNRLRLSKFIAKWCDEDPMFEQLHRPFPKISNKARLNNSEKAK